MDIVLNESCRVFRRAAASSNKYFYRYQPPTPAKELLDEFWRLEKEAEEMLKRLSE